MDIKQESESSPVLDLPLKSTIEESDNMDAILKAIKKEPDVKRSTSKNPNIINLTAESSSSDKSSPPPSSVSIDQSQSMRYDPLKALKKEKPLFSDKFTRILKKLENPEIYKLSSKYESNIKKHLENLNNSYCGCKNNLNFFTTTCPLKRNQDQTETHKREFINNAISHINKIERYVNTIADSCNNAADVAMTQMCKNLSEINKDHCRFYLDYAEKLQIDAFTSTLISLLNSRAEPDYDYTDSMDKRYLFKENLCKFDNSCQKNFNHPDYMCNDEHENIIKQFILTNFTHENLDYGFKQPFSGGMKYVVKLRNQLHTMGMLYMDKLQELHDILSVNF